MHHHRVVIWVQMAAMYWFLLWKGVIYALDGYSIHMKDKVTVQEGLCVTIPCTFTVGYRETFTNSLGIWRDSSNKNVAFSDKSRIGTKPNFHVIGNPDTGNCTLTITDARREDAGSYHFRIEESETSLNKYSYWQKALLSVTDLKEKPQLINDKLIEGKEVNLACIPPGNCTGTSPKFQWMKSDHLGIWRNSSNVTFTPSRSDHHKFVTCTVIFQPGNNVTSESKKLIVRYPPLITVTTAENEIVNRSVNVSTQKRVTLICRADSHPEADVTWYNGNSIVIKNKSEASLNISTMHDTVYVCSAWNDQGMDLQHVEVRLPEQKEQNSTIPSSQGFFNEITVRDMFIGVACGLIISLIIGLLFKFFSRKKTTLKSDFNHLQEIPLSQDSQLNPNNEIYAHVEEPHFQVIETAEHANEPSDLNAVNYASINFSKGVTKDRPEKPESEYSEIKFL